MQAPRASIIFVLFVGLGCSSTSEESIENIGSADVLEQSSRGVCDIGLLGPGQRLNGLRDEELFRLPFAGFANLRAVAIANSGDPSDATISGKVVYRNGSSDRFELESTCGAAPRLLGFRFTQVGALTPTRSLPESEPADGGTGGDAGTSPTSLREVRENCRIFVRRAMNRVVSGIDVTWVSERFVTTSGNSGYYEFQYRSGTEYNYTARYTRENACVLWSVDGSRP